MNIHYAAELEGSECIGRWCIELKSNKRRNHLITLTDSRLGFKFCYKCLHQSSKVEREMLRLGSHCKIRTTWIVFYKCVCVGARSPHFGGCKRPVGTIVTLFAFCLLNFNLVAPIHFPLSLLRVRRRWKVDYLCLTVSCSRPSEPFPLLPILPLRLSGFMLSSGGYCLETFLHQGHN